MKAKLIFVCLILVYVVKFSEQKIQLGKLTYDSNKSLHSLVLNSVNNKVSHDLLAKFSYLSNELTVSKLNNSIEFHSRNKKIGVIKQVLSSNDLVKYTLKFDYSVGNLSETCFDYGHDEWYQTYEERIQKWPIDKKANVTTTPFNTMDFFSNPVGGLVESLWISSSGFAIYADKQLSQLYLRRNPSENGSLCLSASNQFELHLISGLNIMSTYKHAKNEYFKKPKSTSDQLMMQKPIWFVFFEFIN